MAPYVASGHAVCPRCEQLIAPTDEWDAGHVDSLVDGGHPDGARRPEHAYCNRSAGGKSGAARRRARRRPPLTAYLDRTEARRFFGAR